MITRRSLLTLFRGAAAPSAPPGPAEVPPDVAARAKAFREALASRVPTADGPKLAVIAPRLCLLTLGTECGTCLERCPEGAVRLQGRAVEIVAERCTGCGECVSSCPAPVPALALRPVTR